MFVRTGSPVIAPRDARLAWRAVSFATFAFTAAGTVAGGTFDYPEVIDWPTREG
jgi:hypothetical protein